MFVVNPFLLLALLVRSLLLAKAIKTLQIIVGHHHEVV
jgi:hypothetical protein